MFGDRRKHQRYIINRVAKWQLELGTLPRDCMISDISDRGARLFIEGVEAPDQFYLLIDGSHNRREECHVVWRLGGEVGVTFGKVTPDALARKAVFA
jgi:hypothetical protein